MTDLNAKRVEIECNSCKERLDVDFNIADYSSEISIINGKKSERRIFLKQCDDCEHMNYIASEDPEEWGDRQGINANKIMMVGGFSCLVLILLCVVVVFFAGRGILVLFDWLF